MKSKTIFSKYTLIVVSLFFACFSAIGQPTMTIIPSALPAPGNTFTVAVVLNGTQVGNWQTLLDYDHAVLTYQNYTFSAPYNVGVANIEHPTASGTFHLRFSMAYFGGVPGYTYSNQQIVTITFLYNGGNTNLTFYRTNAGTTSIDSYVKANPYNVLNTGTQWIPASIGDITSVAAGGDWSNPASWDLAHVPNNTNRTVIVGSSTNPLTVAANTSWAGDLRISSGGKLTVNSGISFGIGGNMLIKSDATSTGSFVDLGTTTVTGTTTVERYMTGNWNGTWPVVPETAITWHYVASPVSGGTTNSFFGALLNWWDEANDTWQPVISTTDPLIVNKGYSEALTSNKTIIYSGGSLNTGTQIINNLTNTSGNALQNGFNLIGNSYPSAVKWNNSITRQNVEAAAYFWNGTGYISYLADLTDFQIPAGQGFYVHVNVGTPGAIGTVTIPNTNRVHSTNTFIKSSVTEQLCLKVNGNNMADETSIRFNPAATEGFDGEYDAYKLWGINTCPQIYSMTPDVNFSINSLPGMTAQTVVPIGLRVGVTETYTITASGMETFPSGTYVYLEDLLLSNTQNLNTNPVYEFTASPGGVAHRFNIMFSPVSGMPTATSGNIRIYSAQNSVYVNVPMELHGTIIIYDLLGKEVKRKPIESNTLNKINMNVQFGYYLVKVLGDKSTVSGKVFIR